MSSQDPQMRNHDGHATALQNNRRSAGETVAAQQDNRPHVRPGEETAGKWAVLAIVAIGVFMATLDSSIVNISLPTIARNFGVPLNGLIEWVVIAYLVTTSAVLLTAGRLADMIGRKTVWITGLILFTGSSALCGLSPS